MSATTWVQWKLSKEKSFCKDHGQRNAKSLHPLLHFTMFQDIVKGPLTTWFLLYVLVGFTCLVTFRHFGHKNQHDAADESPHVSNHVFHGWIQSSKPHGERLSCLNVLICLNASLFHLASLTMLLLPFLFHVLYIFRNWSSKLVSKHDWHTDIFWRLWKTLLWVKILINMMFKLEKQYRLQSLTFADTLQHETCMLGTFFVWFMCMILSSLTLQDFHLATLWEPASWRTSNGLK